MTGKIPLGVASPYVKTSSGGCTDPMKFYATTYCTAYGREEFKPRMGTHRGTGYKSNYRPVVSYSPAMGALPPLREQVRDGFQTVTGQSYRPLEVPDGKSPLPSSLYQTSSGYSLDKAGPAPTPKEVRKVHFDTQDYGPQAITGLEPKQVPLLQQHQSKGSVEWENAGHGPRFMTSEYNSKFLREPSNQPDLLQKKSIGAKEDSGFTEASAKNPLTSQALPGDPALLPARSTSKADFLPMTPLHGDEVLPQMSRDAERESGFSRVNERILGSRVPPPSLERSSLSQWQFQHPQRVQQTNVSLLGRETVGHKEPSGYSLNNPGYVRSPYNPGLDNPYLTSYNQGYFENIPKGLDREGWTRGGLQPQKPGGYALNQPVTRMEPTPTPTESLRHLHPHVGRTLISTDPFYRSPPHSSCFNTPH
ncbi:protein phosphatase 1 regulatory subunit 32 [Pipistrellus kuhlii]|uniref:protein phosphatase 1 regulatory subunit 32 n=1 Tax=Pipistrellus kuhlii TaxID=59472 RepID=UPI001E273FA7|nr:protein phosphatase 1 regulatory subunit 32 [Pipistrellus kuhlii]